MSNTYNSILARLNTRGVVIGIIPVSAGDAIATAVKCVDAGYRTIMLESEAAKVKRFTKHYNPYDVSMPKQLFQARRKAFNISTYDNGVGFCDIILICGDYLLGDKVGNKRYIALTSMLGRRIFYRSKPIVIAKGSFCPGFMEQVYTPALTLGGVLKDNSDVCMGLATQSALTGKMLAASRTVSLSVVISKILSAIYKKDAEVKTCDVVECLYTVEESYVSTVNALASELRGSLGLCGYNVTDMLETAGITTTQGFDPSAALKSDGTASNVALSAFVRQSKAVPQTVLKAALALSDRACIRVIDRLEAELKKEGKKLSGSSVVIIGSFLRSNPQDEERYKSLPLWKLLKQRGVRLGYYGDTRPTTDSADRNDVRIQYNKRATYDAAIVISDRKGSRYNGIAHAVSFVLDCSGACDSAVTGVLHV